MKRVAISQLMEQSRLKHAVGDDSEEGAEKNFCKDEVSFPVFELELVTENRDNKVKFTVGCRGKTVKYRDHEGVPRDLACPGRSYGHDPEYDLQEQANSRNHQSTSTDDRCQFCYGGS